MAKKKDTDPAAGSGLTDKQQERIQRSIELMAKTRPANIDQLMPYQRNQKDHPEQQIRNVANSLRRFGWRQPVVIDENNVIVIGHCRVLAAKMIGLDVVPVVSADDLTEDEIRELRIVDNKTNESPWNDYLEEDLQELTFEGFDFDMLENQPGGGTSGQEIVDDEYDGEPPADPVACKGDVYQLGQHRLMCGDSTDQHDIDQLMDGAVADVTITSPPYGAAKSAKIRDHYVPGKKGRKSFYNEHDDTASEWGGLITGALQQMRRASKVQFVNIQMLADNKVELIAILNEYREQLIDIIIWDKCKAPPQMHDNVLNNQFEFVFIFGEDDATRVIPYAAFHGNRNNMITFPVGVNEFADVHRAVFPIQFPTEILNIVSKAGTVLDVFGGTGTTMMACEQTGRKCYTMELDPRYVDLIIDRWEKFTGEKAVKIN